MMATTTSQASADMPMISNAAFGHDIRRGKAGSRSARVPLLSSCLDSLTPYSCPATAAHGDVPRIFDEKG
jgi:hypothetical protein